MPEVSHPSPTTAEDFRRVLDERAIQPLFQPLIDLQTRHVLGYEALARGRWDRPWSRRRPCSAPPGGRGRRARLGLPGGRLHRGDRGRTDAVVIAEGIETIKHAREPRRATRDLLVELCMQLEHQGLDETEPNVLLACFQEAGHFTPATRSRYEFLATRAAFTGVLGHGMPVAPVAGVRGADLAADDPLRREWDLVVTGPRFAAALVARDGNDHRPHARRGLDVIVTHDRDLVIGAAEPLLRRLVSEP